MNEDKEAKHGGQKNGKKEGLSGSSFFTWFMVIALLGVWTSVAVVWFDLVDYEEVLAKAKDFRYNLSEVLQGKLGIYDADGDGDFDVDDAKVLLGLKEKSASAKSVLPGQPDDHLQPEDQATRKSEHIDAEVPGPRIFISGWPKDSPARQIPKIYVSDTDSLSVWISKVISTDSLRFLIHTS
ncbi:aspartyl/asparaginyl beta-hydroxylase-like isoform X5 [Vombatus ursinus]|uniref:aspartyl/asparaginyl beta-hydroxylase-like isoform X5 n=1 Tax=Vombatus ursinus TaxID=29139 RepID=UPI000FFD49CF|nr:aspartyl/asparaginyl beta-hydroxylase-like isoform X5 [Vombatus ursinus]XP_027733213.1 aspartyl/asparaginyl beta-hydroxylase-like isoform X5 [Vombatus ursinus]